MNGSNVSLPSSLSISIYYWFLQISAIFSWLLTPFFFYIILTQSKGLKSYKWFIMNHSFWCFALETIIGLFKPMLLLPASAGFPLSVIRENGSYYVSAIGTILGLIFGINYAASLFVTIGSRYLLIFQSRLTNWLTLKLITILTSCTVIVVYLLFFIAAYSALSNDLDTVYQEAIKYDKFFETFHESSLVFVPQQNIKTLSILILICLNFIFVTGIIVIFLFTYLVQRNATVSVSKMQRSMIVSSVVQILLSLLLLDLPITALIIFILFEIPDSAFYGCICLSFISSHNVLEVIATLYFILPYQKFIKQLFRNLFILRKNNEISGAQVKEIK